MADNRNGFESHTMPMIIRLARAGRRALDSSAISGGLRQRHVLALEVLNRQGSMSQQTLGDAISADPGNVVGILNDLEADGLITRRRDAGDRRRHIVAISEAGAIALQAASERHATVEDDLLAALSDEERATLHRLLERAVGGADVTCREVDPSGD